MTHSGIPTLTTDRLVLRPFVPEDLDELAPIHAEESFWWYPLRAGMTRRRRISSSSASWRVMRATASGSRRSSTGTRAP